MATMKDTHNVNVFGSGEQVVVLSHGGGTDQSLWRHLVPRLEGEYQVVLFDNMGAGTTNPDNFDFTRYSVIDGHVNDLLAILEELHVKSCIYVGHSFSAMVGAIASIARPDLFSKIIMIAVTPRLCNDVDYHGGFEKETLERSLEGLATDYEAEIMGNAPIIVGGELDSEPVQDFVRTLSSMKPHIASCTTHMVHNMDVRGILPLIRVPCHILQSMKDIFVPPSVTKFLRRNINAPCIVELMTVEGHLPQWSAPDVVIPVIFKHIHDIFLY